MQDWIEAAEPGNAFLDGFSASVRDGLQPHAAVVDLSSGDVICRPGEVGETTYFPIRAVISTIAPMLDGNAVEVGLAGHESFGSLALAFASRRTPHTSIVQVPGSAIRIPTADFLAVVSEDAGAMQRIAAVAEYSFIAAAQFAACNRIHTIAQRYARWLLMAHDRTGLDAFNLTQQFSAQMLGVRRAGVTMVAGRMSAEGLISYHRGLVTIRNRSLLEQAACECYGLVNGEFRRLLGFDVRREESA